MVIKKRDHVHVNAVEESCLMDGHIDSMVARLEQEVGLFWRFNPGRQEDRSATGRADPEITVPLVDIFDHFGNNRDLTQTGAVMRMSEHVALVIGSVR